MISILYNVFQKIEAEETHPNLSCEVTITLILNPNKDITRKEKYKPISLINIDAKIFPT